MPNTAPYDANFTVPERLHVAALFHRRVGEHLRLYDQSHG
jgi:hypothetical protein